jgi:hypothetical protein
MARIAEPITIHKRGNSFQFTLNSTCGLPRRVCAEWQRRSFRTLPEELSNYRNPNSKPEAKAHAQVLIAYLKMKQSEGGTQRARAETITVGEFARDMFTHGAAHIKRWTEKGFVLKTQTIAQHRRHLTKYILPRFGKLRFTEITPTKVEDFLLEQQLSNSSQNTILYTLQLVMREAKRAGVFEIVPEFEPFKRNSKRQDTLSGEELIKPIANYYILDRFCFGLDRMKIDHEMRRLTVHCLRYTYNTRMKMKVPGDVLRGFLGHRSVEMTDHWVCSMDNWIDLLEENGDNMQKYGLGCNETKKSDSK